MIKQTTRKPKENVINQHQFFFVIIENVVFRFIHLLSQISYLPMQKESASPFN